MTPKQELLASLIGAAALLLALLPQADRAYAATFTVTTTQDAPHTNPLNGNCTSTLTGNPCTLRAAIQAVNSLGGGPHTINLQVAGTYALTIVGPNEDNAATGDLDVNGVTLTIANTSGGEVAIDGNRTDRVFHDGASTPARLTITGVTLQNGQLGQTGFFPPAGGPGGAVFVTSGSELTLTDAIVTGNSAGLGAGIDNVGTMTLTRVTMRNNTTGGGGRGGGILNEGTAVLTDVNVSDNVAPGAANGPGGAGGGIANFGTLTLSRVTLSNNSASGGFQPFSGGAGGGLYNDFMANATLTNATISGNSVTAGTSTFQGGAPGTGGGIFNSTTINLTNVTVNANTATGLGGTPGIGGGIASTGTTILRNTIIASSVGAANCSGAIISEGGNVSSDNFCNLAGPGDRSSSDPRLAPLQNNGGFTATHALLPGSQALDAGQGCPPPSADQRGVTRPQGPACDSGAFELQTTIPPTLTPTVTPTTTRTRTPTATQTPTPTNLTVQQAIALVQPSGQAGTPCASQVGQTCTATGAVRGTGTVIGSMAWSLTATVPAGVAAGTIPVAVIPATAGLQGFACAPVAAGASTVTCTGLTGANALQGAAITVVFAPGVTAVGTVTGPGPAGAAGARAGAAVAPLLPPVLVNPPPPPILLPPPPPPVLPIGGPLLPSLLEGAMPAPTATPGPAGSGDEGSAAEARVRELQAQITALVARLARAEQQAESERAERARLETTLRDHQQQLPVLVDELVRAALAAGGAGEAAPALPAEDRR